MKRTLITFILLLTATLSYGQETRTFISTSHGTSFFGTHDGPATHSYNGSISFGWNINDRVSLGITSTYTTYQIPYYGYKVISVTPEVGVRLFSVGAYSPSIFLNAGYGFEIFDKSEDRFVSALGLNHTFEITSHFSFNLITALGYDAWWVRYTYTNEMLIQKPNGGYYVWEGEPITVNKNINQLKFNLSLGITYRF